jgi:hypothetical protein
MKLNIVLPPLQVELHQILLLLLGFLSFIYLARIFIAKLNNPQKTKRFRFLKEGRFAWKVNKYDGEIGFEPYCIRHKIKLIKNFNYVNYEKIYKFYCSECKSTITNVTKQQLDYNREVIANKVELLYDSNKL